MTVQMEQLLEFIRGNPDRARIKTGTCCTDDDAKL
jgi:hypothetical protein